MSGKHAQRRSRSRQRSRLRYALEFAGLRLLRVLMRLLPMDAASAFMGWCWRTIAPHTRRHPRALRHLTLAYPEKPLAECEAIARAMWANLGRVFAESFFLDKLLAAGRVDDRTAPLLRRVREEAAGIVFVSIHSGNWELAISPAKAAAIPAAGIYQTVKNPYVDAYLAAQRHDSYPLGLFAKGTDVARRLLRIVRGGGAIAMLADLRDRSGPAVPFFGRPAPSTMFPALVCRSAGATLVGARVVRTRGVNFVIEGEVIELDWTDDREADMIEATRRIQARFEEWVREYPEQWMWAHRRWS